MAFTPICPECGSAAVMNTGPRGRPVGSNLRLECARCHYAGLGATFMRNEDHMDDEDYSEAAIRKHGDYMPTRTIPLSDE